MLVSRLRYIERLKKSINNKDIKCIVLDGPRSGGKKTLLNYLYHDDAIEMKKYYFSFSDDISTKHFKDSHEFISFMQIKFGINFSEPNLLFLNEIQYSKNIGKIIHDLINVHKIRTKIIATGITQGDYKDFLQLSEKDFEVIVVHTFDFTDFLKFKGFHTEHLDPLNISQILFDELQPLLQEFITRGGYPSVISAHTEDEKKEALKFLMQSSITKDVNFWFTKDDIGYFENILHIINDQYARIHNKRAIKNTYNIPTRIIDKYTHFLEDHFLITTLRHFFSDKTTEVSHRKMSVLLDMGIKNYLHDSFSVSPHDPRTMSYMTLHEIYKNIRADQNICTYKKINGSHIEFIITDGEKVIPVVIGRKNTDSIPKVFTGFEEIYGDKVEYYIKTSFSASGTKYINGKPVYTIPYFLIGKHLQNQNKAI